MTQVTGGVIAGVVLIALVSKVASNTTQFEGTGIGVLTAADYVLLAGYAILMLGVCALACIVPTLRALRCSRLKRCEPNEPGAPERGRGLRGGSSGELKRKRVYALTCDIYFPYRDAPVGPAHFPAVSVQHGHL